MEGLTMQFSFDVWTMIYGKCRCYVRNGTRFYCSPCINIINAGGKA